jgi:hypothetical protein
MAGIDADLATLRATALWVAIKTGRLAVRALGALARIGWRQGSGLLTVLRRRSRSLSAGQAGARKR